MMNVTTVIRILLALAGVVVIFLIAATLWGQGQTQILASGVMSILIGTWGIWFSISAIRSGSINTVRAVHFRSESPFSFWLNCFVMFFVGLVFVIYGPFLFASQHF